MAPRNTQLVCERTGLIGAHLLATETPATKGPTTEQQIRGKDKTADWIVIVSGYDGHRLQDALKAEFAPSALEKAGAQNGALADIYTLSSSLTPADLATPQHLGAMES